MDIKHIIVLLLAATVLSGYTLPFHGAQSVYYRETLGQKSVSKVTFKTDQGTDPITLTRSDKSSSDPLKYVLANLFLAGQKHMTEFGARAGIVGWKTHFALIEETPTICYGRKVATDAGSMLCLENEQFYPVKTVFTLGSDQVTVQFTEYKFEDRGFRFPTRVEITTKGETTIHTLSQIRFQR